MSSKKNDYQSLSSELDEVMLTLQQDDVDIDIAMAAYQRGLKLVEQIEMYLQQAENTITKLQAVTKTGA